MQKKEMQNHAVHKVNPSVYPGEYVPPFKENDIEKIKSLSKNEAVTIQEQADSYKIEFPIPGAKRENLLLKAHDNVLYISVIKDHDPFDPRKNNQLNTFNFERTLPQKIELPRNADPLFLSAEYKSGILQLIVSKSAHPLKGVNTKIAIY